MSSGNTISFADTLAGRARGRVSGKPRRSQLRSTVSTQMPNRLSTFRMINNAEINGSTLSLGAPRKVFQAETVVTPGDENGRSGGEILIWSHGRFKCAKIRRRDESGVLRIKMYESHAQVTIFLPRDFHGVVGRVGQSGRSIACSHPALYLKESNNLRFNAVPDETEDLVLVRTEKILRVCVVDDDPPLPPAGRGRSFSD